MEALEPRGFKLTLTHSTVVNRNVPIAPKTLPSKHIGRQSPKEQGKGAESPEQQTPKRYEHAVQSAYV